MIRTSKKYSIEFTKVNGDVSINVSLEMSMSPELAELVLRDLQTDIKDFNEARILAEIVRDPIIIYSLCQRLEEVKNEQPIPPEVKNSNSEVRLAEARTPEWSLHATS